MDYYFTTNGDKNSGTYIVHECSNGQTIEISRFEGEHYEGLKKARQSIGEYLIGKEYSIDQVVPHQTIVRGRKYNPIHHWTVEQYLYGVPPSSLNKD